MQRRAGFQLGVVAGDIRAAILGEGFQRPVVLEFVLEAGELRDYCLAFGLGIGVFGVCYRLVYIINGLCLVMLGCETTSRRERQTCQYDRPSVAG